MDEVTAILLRDFPETHEFVIMAQEDWAKVVAHIKSAGAPDDIKGIRVLSLEMEG